VGERVNYGAGSITANYDGANKHRTVIEADVHIGSNCVLVAPVTIGAGATVGGGSTITKDVPAGALAVARGKQVSHCRTGSAPPSSPSHERSAVGPVGRLPGARRSRGRTVRRTRRPGAARLAGPQRAATGRAGGALQALHAVSHDLRAPLRHITSYGPLVRELLQEAPGLDAAEARAGGAGISGHHGPVGPAHGPHARRPAGAGAHCRAPLRLQTVDLGALVHVQCARPLAAALRRPPVQWQWRTAPAYRAGRPGLAASCWPSCRQRAQVHASAQPGLHCA
jgi:hypothetical protein